MTGRSRKRLFATAKILLAGALLAWVASQVHWRDYVVSRSDGKAYAILQALPSADAPRKLVLRTGFLWSSGTTDPRDVAEFVPLPGSDQVIRTGFASCIADLKTALLAVAIGANLLVMPILALRWRLLLRTARIDLSFWEALRLTFLGQFFNTVVPGTVGGDLVKAYYVSKHTPHKAAALVSVMMDRVLGLTELTLLASVMLLVVWAAGMAPVGELRLPAVLVAIILSGMVAVFVFLFSARARQMLRLQKLYQHLPLAHHIAAAGEVTRLYRRNVTSMVKAVLLTVLIHVTWIGSIILTGAALSLATPWHGYFLYIPLIYTIGAVPLTPGGVGLVEKFYLVFFVTAMCSPSRVLALALLVRLTPVVVSLPGAVVAITGAKLPKTEALEAELGIK
jgi:hypothetical protein